VELLQRNVNKVKVLQVGEKVHLGKPRDGPNYGSKSAKDLGERGQKLSGLNIQVES